MVPLPSPHTHTGSVGQVGVLLSLSSAQSLLLVGLGLRLGCPRHGARCKLVACVGVRGGKEDPERGASWRDQERNPGAVPKGWTEREQRAPGGGTQGRGADGDSGQQGTDGPGIEERGPAATFSGRGLQGGTRLQGGGSRARGLYLRRMNQTNVLPEHTALRTTLCQTGKRGPAPVRAVWGLCVPSARCPRVQVLPPILTGWPGDVFT